ncbi:MAG: UvrD-helicase domain-containing protein [Sandaracinaceae bacterium]|nr:UvrD-helicase domain-containing protein [Sandaracinaceae bacterium]
MSDSPVDQDVRDRAIGRVGESMALSAGAGSGKTSVLTDRLVEVLASGVPPSRVAAITFTEKAAGELQRRVRDALEARLVAKGDDPALRAQLDRFHELTLTTIHSFCLGLLKAEPLASRWAPGTEVAEHDQRGLATGIRAWRRAIANRDPRLLGLFDIKLPEISLTRGVLALWANRDLTPLVGDEHLDWEAAHAELLAVHEHVEAVAARCASPRDKLLTNNAPFRERLAEWAASPPGEVTLAALLATHVKPDRRGGTKANWGPDGIDDFKEALNAIDAWRATCFVRAQRDLVLSIREHVFPVMESARFENAVANFDDLLFRAAALLREPDPRARLSARFDAVLIDEVQDTDPIQAEVAALLSRDPTVDGDWLSAAPWPGHLFAVGDPKQSIYRFRRADVTVWRDLAELVASDGHAEELTQNFRSVPGIVDWVAHVFEDMEDFTPQVAWRGRAALDPVVVIESDVDAELDHAVRHLFDLKENGAQAVDRESGELRPMRWGDVMVVVPRWAKAPELAAMFERAGVEAIVGGGGTFFLGEEVRLAMSALRALDEPADTEATVHVLRGLFGFTLEDLATHAAAGGSFRYTVPEQPAGNVRDALETLRDLRLSRVESWVPPLDRLLEETRASAVWSLLADGQSRLANLDKLRVMIRSLEAETRSPSAVVSELVKASRDSEADLSRADPESDAVTITTVFSAKGLEAPIVVLLDAFRKLGDPTVFVDRRAGTVAIKIGSGFASPGWPDIAEADKDAQHAERRRWMYVATTRARDQLVILRHDKANLLEHIASGWDADALEHEAHQTLADGVEVRIRVGDELPSVDYGSETFPGRDPEVDRWIANPAGKGDPAGESRDGAQRAAVSASKRKCMKSKSVGELVSRSRAPVWGSGVGTVGGRVVHRAMEHLDLSQTADALEPQIDPLIGALAVELGLDEDMTDKCADVVRKILRHPVMDEVRDATELWKEVPFAFHDRGRAVHGVIDLCFPEDAELKRWVVVDWKSDLPPEGDPVRASYEQQVAIYAKAVLQTVAPCESVRTVLVGPYEEIPSTPDREAVLTEVDAAIRGGLLALLRSGATVPRVGADIGEPVVANLELAWEAARVGLGLDLSPDESAGLAKIGWDVVVADTAELGWARTAVAALREKLGLPDEGEDDEDDLASVSAEEAEGEGETDD